jgi:hypothetical protein
LAKPGVAINARHCLYCGAVSWEESEFCPFFT